MNHSDCGIQSVLSKRVKTVPFKNKSKVLFFKTASPVVFENE